ncbi:MULTISPECIES: amino acid ABC transporter permease [Amycolatopsis]|uniref:Amino acid ABC transporter permease n=1 Tax=Amycolatopsis dendrobii TaxID=2760662 RepID=A0A7W3VYW4_9PSEU|nr:MULTISPECIES: amino acid ABC transporter permease [Amycolatopsis]MBB1155768.1 amino acid ABC transporter permease [Amycolatopsis dendrobii]UKD52971.1 amino acid ABC transporter permease [Amycolatopsis sp. FU40]
MDQFFDTFLNWQYIWEVFPDLLKTGLLNTLILSVAAAVIGTLLGMVLAVMGLSAKRWLRWPARVYTDIFRGLPAILTILVIGQGVGLLARNVVGNNPYPLGIAALSLIAAAYIGEIFRAGIQSVDKGQLEASRALGMSYSKAMLLVVIPQGVRRVLPALVNQFIALVKDSTLVYFLGFLTSQRELFRIGQDLAANTGNLSPLVAAGAVYLVITVPLTHLVNYIDKRLQTGRKVTAENNEMLAGGAAI